MSEIAHRSRSSRLLTNRRLGALFVVTVLVVAVTLFVADNFAIVYVRVFTVALETRLAWVMLACLCVGVVLGFALAWFLGRGRGNRRLG